jgi:succinate dehydrogenase / fumarate reductase flavoprotein subunit
MEEKYPELGNLMPRDVVSREEWAVMVDPACDGHIYLDMRGLSRSIWRNRLSDLRDEIKHYLAIDPARKAIPVEPGIHYCMGGILVDEAHRTNVRDLYAAGECACAYHGANRLGGNSLLGAIRGGMVAARSIGMTRGDTVQRGCSPAQEGVATTNWTTEHAMREALVGCMGIVRTGDGLSVGLAKLEDLCVTPRVNLARAVVACALAREESRGAHQRADYPETLEEYRRTTVVRWENDGPSIEFRPLAEPLEGVPRS